MVIRKKGKLEQTEASKVSLTDTGLLFPALSLSPPHPKYPQTGALRLEEGSRRGGGRYET